MVKRNLDQPVLALFVRFVPKEWKRWPCMRVEVYGKPASKSKREPILPKGLPSGDSKRSFGGYQVFFGGERINKELSLIIRKSTLLLSLINSL